MEKNRNRDDDTPYRGFWRTLTTALLRPSKLRVVDLFCLVAAALPSFAALMMLAAGCGLIGDVPQQDRIPVAAIFHEVVGWFNQ